MYSLKKSLVALAEPLRIVVLKKIPGRVMGSPRLFRRKV